MDVSLSSYTKKLKLGHQVVLSWLSWLLLRSPASPHQCIPRTLAARSRYPGDLWSAHRISYLKVFTLTDLHSFLFWLNIPQVKSNFHDLKHSSLSKSFEARRCDKRKEECFILPRRIVICTAGDLDGGEKTISYLHSPLRWIGDPPWAPLGRSAPHLKKTGHLHGN